jgi:hypothetical protein
MQSASDLGMNWIWFKYHQQLFTEEDRFLKPLDGDELKLIANAPSDVDQGTIKAQKAFLQNIYVLCAQLEIDPTKFTYEDALDFFSNELVTMFRFGFVVQQAVLCLKHGGDENANAGLRPNQLMKFIPELADTPHIFANTRPMKQINALWLQKPIVHGMSDEFREVISRYENEYRTWTVSDGVTIGHYNMILELNHARLNCMRTV